MLNFEAVKHWALHLLKFKQASICLQLLLAPSWASESISLENYVEIVQHFTQLFATFDKFLVASFC